MSVEFVFWTVVLARFEVRSPVPGVLRLRHAPAQLIATGAQLSSEPDRVAELAAVPLPFHVVSGESDDVWPVPLMDEMALRLGARRTVIEGAEHSPNTARPLETAAALISFWKGV